MLLTIVEKERRHKEAIRQRAVVSELAIRSASYVRYLHRDNARLNSRVNELEGEVKALQRALSSKFLEHFKKQATFMLAKAIVEKFKEQAARLFDVNIVEEMGAVVMQCLDYGIPMSITAASHFEHILDLADFVIDSRRSFSPHSIRGGDVEYEAVVYWSRENQFCVGIELPKDDLNDLKKVEEAYQNQSN